MNVGDRVEPTQEQMLVSKGTKGYVKELGWLGDSGECLVAFDNGKAEMIPIVALRRI